MTRQEKEERKRTEEALFEMLFALARAFSDHTRPHIRTQGIEERDLAFEAGRLTPMEVESTIYATQKRSGVLRLLRTMKARDWIEMEPRPPYGLYHVTLKPQGAQYIQERLRPWWAGIGDWLRMRLRGRGRPQDAP